MTSTMQGLTRKRKAAMVVQMIVGNGDQLKLASLPLSLQEALADELRSIRLVDKTTVNTVANEFVGALEEVGLIAPGNAEDVLKTLGDHISPALASKLRADIANAKMSDPWPMLTALPVEDLVRVMQVQSVQIAAVVLSKLTVGKAAEILGKLPGPRARQITYAISQTSDISPGMVSQIGTALVHEHCVSSAVAFERDAGQRVGEILNSSAADTRNSMLESLTDTDALFADEVRRAIFTFEDIAIRIVPTDVAACIRNVDPDTLNMALGGATAAGGALAASADFILSNISQRMAGQIRESIAELGKIKPADGDKAMNGVTGAIRELVDDGTIKLIETEEDAD
ncbi:FliG C-terminal domain-containing protein [Yoonia sp. 208BN28-4]|uniref:FliG C-terminal domain-containing protein n=1 Tax=Yoonia sp. 208BN28-4 TaxID=3126505 RepID=UPI0030A22CF0